MSDVQTKLELALKAYGEAQEELADATHYAGHGVEDMNEGTRIVWTCASAGGPYVHAGIYECLVEVLVVTKPNAVELMTALKNALLALLCEENLPALLSAVNRPEAGPDDRAVTGFGLSGLAMQENGIAEGRDPEKSLMGTRVSYTAWAHLEAE